MGGHIDRFNQVEAVLLSQGDDGLKITDSLMGRLAFKPGIKLSIAWTRQSPFAMKRAIDDPYGIFRQRLVHPLKKGLNLGPGHDMKGIGRKKAVKAYGRPKGLHIEGHRGGCILKVCFIEPETNPRKVLFSI